MIDSWYTLFHDHQFSKLELLDTEGFSKADFILQRARGAYIAAVYRPDLTFAFSYAAQVMERTKDDVVKLNGSISYALSSDEQILEFVRL